MHTAKNKAYEMEGPSMMPTINMGDRVKVKVVPAEQVEHGDLIVFKDATGGNRLIKRVVGLPGDVVTIADGKLTVTKPDSTLYIPYDDNNTAGENVTVTVESDSFYVIGDNRSSSLDSRSFGQVLFTALIGVVNE